MRGYKKYFKLIIAKRRRLATQLRGTNELIRYGREQQVLSSSERNLKMRILLFVCTNVLCMYFACANPLNDEHGDGKLVFRPMMHQPRIYAGAPAGVHVTTVHAYDPDRPRKKVEYNLPNVLDYKNFIVDKISGNLSTVLMVNKTIGETYQVMVAAVSSGSSELEHIQIAVTEFNQFSPRFEQRNYTLELHQKTEVDTIVLKVRAADPDPAPHNAEIYYKLDQNSSSQFFVIDSFSGELFLSQTLNESEPMQNFGIFAEDGGSPKRWDYVPIIVVMKTLSAPQNVLVLNVTHNTAIVCWDAPLYGNVSGYVGKYYSVESDEQLLLNVTVENGSGYCENLENLTDDMDYQLQIYGWNSDEDGQKTDIFKFHTADNWCKKVTCQAAGHCVPQYSEPWYQCDCPVGFYGTSCEFFDPCSRNPCGDNGKCLNITHNEYVCICDEDYTGPDCGYYNPCLSRRDLCENGATCEMTTNKTYVCICAEGFYGRKCKYRNLCLSTPCENGGTCNNTSETTFECSCPVGFKGVTCETEIDECASNPCFNGSTCVDQIGNFSCVCSSGFIGRSCEKSVQCPADKTDTQKGMFYWNATNISLEVVVQCPFGSLGSSSEAFAYRQCFLQNQSAVWGPVNTNECKGKEFLVADELADELHSITKDAGALNTDTLEAAAQGIETISTFATQDKKIAEGMVKVISNLMEVNDTIVKQDENNTFTEFSKNLLQIVDDFASNVPLKPGESLNVAAENVRIQAMEWHPELENLTSEELTFTAPNQRDALPESDVISTPKPSIPITDMAVSTSAPEKQKVPMMKVYLPKEALQEAHKQMEGSVRIKFVVYYNDKLFQSKQSNQPEVPKPQTVENKILNDPEPEAESNEPAFQAPVIQISVGNVSLKNMFKPLIYVLPLVTKRDVLCVYWNEKERHWSADGLTTNHTETLIICQSTHMTAFSVLLDLTPRALNSKTHESILSIISYVGSVLSILGLSLTIITYLLFGCLNRDQTGRILSNLCFSLLLMNSTFLAEALEPAIGGNACAAVGLLLHYFVLTSLFWMCVEAINMYQLLVHVFASSESHFMLKRCAFAWGVPFLIVTLTASFNLDAYYEGLLYCMLSPRNPWIYYCSFLGPSCVILVVNFAVFIMVSRVIFTPRLTAKTSSDSNPAVTASQVRGAFTVMVLLGVTWVFGTMAFGEVKLIFQYAFCIANSLQGFLIFLVRCLLYPEARNAWMYLFKTGKLKMHRGIVPPVSFSNSQSGKNAASTHQSASRNGSSEDSPCVALDETLFGRKKKNEDNQIIKNENWLQDAQVTVAQVTVDKLPSLDQRAIAHLTRKERNVAILRNGKNTFPKMQRNETEKRRKICNNYFATNQVEEIYGSVNSTLQTISPYSFDKTIEVPVGSEELNSNPKRTGKESPNFAPATIMKKNLHLPFSEKQDVELRKKRSVSLNTVPSLDENHEEDCLPINTTIEGLKLFFSNMKLRSNEQVSKDRRAFSLDSETPEKAAKPALKRRIGANAKKERPNRRIAFKRHNSIVFEREDELTDDEDSTSTDVEDSPPVSAAEFSCSRRYTHSSDSRIDAKDRSPKNTCYHCRFGENCDGSSLPYTPPTSLKRNQDDFKK